MAALPPPLQYDVEADWALLHTCNYRCDYCFLTPEMLGSRLQVHADADGWARAFASTRRTWLLHITGGEPAIYPRFAELCARLAERHFLSLNTNLSRPVIEEFIERVPPGRVHFIHAALHAEERLNRGGLEQFVARAVRLREAGYFVMCSLVMTPGGIAEYPRYRDALGARGLALHPKVLRGPHLGRVFPASYSPDEKHRLRRYIAEAAAFAGADPAPMGASPSIDLFREAGLIEGRGDFRGRLCASGSRFVRIEPDGTVFRCGTAESLGNLLNSSLRLLASPRACDTSYCPYFCEKYTRPEFLALHDAPAGNP